MNPLYCETCGGAIERMEDGWVEWLRKDRKTADFRICHHDPNCHQLEDSPKTDKGWRLQSHHLATYLGPVGFFRFLNTVLYGQNVTDEILRFLNKLIVSDFMLTAWSSPGMERPELGAR